MSLQQMCLGSAGTRALVNLAFKLKWEKENRRVHGISLGLVKKINKKNIEKDRLIGYSLKIGFRPICPCVFEGGQSKGSQEGR